MTRQEKKIGCHRSAGPSKHLLFLAGAGFRGCNSLPTRAILEGSMKYRRRFFLFLLLVSFPVQAAAQAKEALKLVATIPLPGLKDGDFDHFATDIDGHRLFLTDEENDKVDVLDTATNTRIQTMEDAKAPTLEPSAAGEYEAVMASLFFTPVSVPVTAAVAVNAVPRY